MIDRIYRQTVLGVATQKPVEQLVRTRAWGVAQRFVAGEDVGSALKAVAELREQGIRSNLDLLGEFIDSPEKASEFADKVIHMLEASGQAGAEVYASVKLSSVGQGQTVDGQDLGLVNARRILDVARRLNGFVCLDMEDHSRVDATLAQFRTLVGEYGQQTVGTVLQSYLYRSEKDRAALDDLSPNLRIVKGAYLEPESVAYPDKTDVDSAYRRLVYANLGAGNYTNIASHDEKIIGDVKHFVLAHGIDKSRFEFQMLYGIRRDLQRELAEAGFTVRAYIPYGRDWYAYFSRRIAERPANVMFVLRGMLKG